MRFYVPEWDDNVDADYHFVHDEHSSISKQDRNLQYIWDIFDHETTPIDGVLISREQVQETVSKFDRVTEHGVYDPGSRLDIPDWLPTISDCGAWGYKSLPFPPYGNEDMLEFYDEIDVTVGVTIDHLVLGSGHEGRLYLDKRGFSGEYSSDDLPEVLEDSIDVMVDEWPDDWPGYVREYEPSICDVDEVDPFTEDDFEGEPEEILDRLQSDSRAVYRDDDMQFRYDLTLKNAKEMWELYQQRDWPFRLMVAVQGWDPQSYADATSEVLDIGYQYLGIGGVAGSPVEAVRNIVSEVGTVVKDHERKHETRIDHHVFGFAKTDAFETIGRSGVTSFDSASMLRAAWTGGENYHLDSDTRYDAIRVRFPTNRDDLSTSVEKALYAQEVLRGLRAYDRGEALSTALSEWQEDASIALREIVPYLEEHRWDEQFDRRRLRDIEENFRGDYEHAGELKASFSDSLRGKLVKLLRRDSEDSPVDFEEYTELIDEARSVFEEGFPQHLDEIRRREENAGEHATFKQIWALVREYAEFIGDERLLDEYEKTLRNEPWNDCDCPICEEYGIEVAIFRGNNRNRRRGFHNTRRFYDQFEQELPKTLVATPAGASLSGDTIEDQLASREPAFWDAVHDLPVTEVGMLSADGVHEWWEPVPERVSLGPAKMAESLREDCTRYQSMYVYAPDRGLDERVRSAIEDTDCTVIEYAEPSELRQAVLDELEYGSEFLPTRAVQSGLGDF